MKEWLNEQKKQRLGEEPSQDSAEAVNIVFRKPVGNERIQRRFLKDDKIERLYDFIDLMPRE